MNKQLAQRTQLILKSCPCCCGEPMHSSMDVKGTTFWQVGCTGCGLSSALDESKEFTTLSWNTRQESDRLSMWVTWLAVCVPAGVVLSFLSGCFISLF